MPTSPLFSVTTWRPAGAVRRCSLNGVAAPVVYMFATQLNFQIPPGFPLGPAALQINNGFVSVVSGDARRSTARARGDQHAAIRRERGFQPCWYGLIDTVNPGDVVSVQVSNVDSGIATSPGSVTVTLSGIPMAVQSVTPTGGGTYQVTFAVTQSFGGWQVPLVVSINGSPSLAIQVTAR